jgi:hypothetical protein
MVHYRDKKVVGVSVRFSCAASLSVPGFASNDELRRDWKPLRRGGCHCRCLRDMGFNRVLGLNPSFSPLPLGLGLRPTLATASIAYGPANRERALAVVMRLKYR